MNLLIVVIGSLGLLLLGGALLDSIRKDKSPSYVSEESMTYWSKRDQRERIQKGSVL